MLFNFSFVIQLKILKKLFQMNKLKLHSIHELISVDCEFKHVEKLVMMGIKNS